MNWRNKKEYHHRHNNNNIFNYQEKNTHSNNYNNGNTLNYSKFSRDSHHDGNNEEEKKLIYNVLNLENNYSNNNNHNDCKNGNNCNLGNLFLIHSGFRIDKNNTNNDNNIIDKYKDNIKGDCTIVDGLLFIGINSRVESNEVRKETRTFSVKEYALLLLLLRKNLDGI